MDPEEILKRAGVFVLVLAVVVGTVALSPMAQPAAPEEPADLSSVTVDSFQPDTILSSMDDESGEITMSADGTDSVVLVDLAHENDISEEQLGPIVRTLTENGATIRFLDRDQTRGEEFNESLREADAFVSISPGTAYSAEQVNSLGEFADAGGRVLLLQEPMQMGLGGIVFFPRETGEPAPMASLASEFGLAFGNGYLYNMAENDNNYRTIYATPGGDSTLSEGVEQVAIREGTTVHGGQSVLTATDGTTLSTTRDEGTYSLAATEGNVTAVGDTTFFTETGYQDADNEVLTGQLLDFLVSGEKAEGVPGATDDETETTGPEGEEQPPRPPQE